MHESGCFVLPNPWDIGTTIYLEHLGFEALATTSAGFAFSRGKRDGGVPRDEMLAHIREIVEVTPLPVNADFLAGYADEPEGVATNVRLCVATGLPVYQSKTTQVGQTPHSMRKNWPSIVFEQRARRSTLGQWRRPNRPLRNVAGARSRSIPYGSRRLVAYAEAGADCLYAPGVSNPDEIAADREDRLTQACQYSCLRVQSPSFIVAIG